MAYNPLIWQRQMQLTGAYAASGSESDVLKLNTPQHCTSQLQNPASFQQTAALSNLQHSHDVAHGTEITHHNLSTCSTEILGSSASVLHGCAPTVQAQHARQEHLSVPLPLHFYPASSQTHQHEASYLFNHLQPAAPKAAYNQHIAAPPQPVPLNLPPHLQPPIRQHQQQAATAEPSLSELLVAARNTATTSSSFHTHSTVQAPAQLSSGVVPPSRTPPGFSFGTSIVPIIAAANPAEVFDVPAAVAHGPQIESPAPAISSTPADSPAGLGALSQAASFSGSSTSQPVPATAIPGASADPAVAPAIPTVRQQAPADFVAATTTVPPKLWSAIAASTSASTPPSSAAAANQQHEAGTVKYAAKKQRPTFKQMQNRLKRECQSGKAAGQLQYSLKEGMKWLQGYNKEAADAVDDIAMKHLQLIERKHGSAVLACVVFFAMGHHETCYGEHRSLTLSTADHPAKVLNKRLTFYQVMFSSGPAGKADMLAALVALRPDVACHLSGDCLKRIFSSSVTANNAAGALAALMMLPEGWETVCEPLDFVTNVITVVMQDSSQAEEIVAYIEGELSATQADSSQVAASQALSDAAAAAADLARTAAAAAPRVSDAGSSSSSNNQVMSNSHTAVFAHQRQQQQQQPGSTTGAWVPHSTAQLQVQQELLCSVARGTGPHAAIHSSRHMQQQSLAAAAASKGSSPALSRQQTPQSSRPASSAGTPTAAAAAATVRSGNRSMVAADNAAPASNSTTNSNDIIELALVQLQQERPDVVAFATRDLRDRIKTLDCDAALAAVGELMALPQDWHKGLGKGGKPKPSDHLCSVVSRAAAHAAGVCDTHASSIGGGRGDGDIGGAVYGSIGSSSDGNADEDGWVTMRKQKSASNGSSSAMTAAAAKAVDNHHSTAGGHVQHVMSADLDVNAAWAELERTTPWLMQHVDKRLRAEMKAEQGQPLTAKQQLQVLKVLDSMSQGNVSRAINPKSMLMAVIKHAKRFLLEPAPAKLQAALQSFARKHPDVMPYFDEGVHSRLIGLAKNDLQVALDTVAMLEATDYPKDIEKKWKNPSAYIMGIISTYLKS